MDKSVELLAPAGDYEAFLAAVENGADAVYLGGKILNARQFAENFEYAELEKALDYAHVRGVKVYLVMNTLVTDTEIKEALDFLETAYTMGIDGVIVQDIGFAGMVKRLFPELSLHASTQMTIYNLEGVKVLEQLGFSRAVLARELSLKEISHITKNTSLEIEIFVHGALCISYSGQCLMSSMIGGRSGNRGKCAQPCRLPYELLGETLQAKKSSFMGKGYLLSPKDLCSIESLHSVLDSGVKSLKIEGRMKGPEYVAVVVGTYRKYIDLLLGNTKDNLKKGAVEPKDIHNLAQAFNRGGFSEGYLKGKSGSSMMCFDKPKNWGTFLGEVVSYDKGVRTLKVRLENDLSLGDGIEVLNGENENPGTVVSEMKMQDKNIKSAGKGNVVSVGNILGNIAKAQKVYKTTDKNLNISARESYTKSPAKRVGLTGQMEIRSGQPIKFSLQDDLNHQVCVEGTLIPEAAINKPLTEERITGQLNKTGATPFYFKQIEIVLDENLSVPISEINDIRRKAIEEVEKARIISYKRALPGEIKEKDNNLLNFPGNNQNKSRNLSVTVQFYQRNDNFDLSKINADRIYLPFSMFLKEDSSRYRMQLGNKDCEVFVWVPPITRGNYDKLLVAKLSDIATSGIHGFLVGNLGTIEFLKDFPELKIMGDFSLNVLNSYSIKELQALGLSGITLSPELNLNQIRKLKDISGISMEVLAYGRVPVMTSEYCPVGSITGGFNKNAKCSGGCDKGNYSIRDRMGVEFPVVCDKIDCRSVILNSNVLFMADKVSELRDSGVDSIRLNITDETREEVYQLVDMHKEAVNKAHIAKEYGDFIERVKSRGFTKGHFFRGV